MANSDTKYGLFNKKTVILSQIIVDVEDKETKTTVKSEPTNHASVDAAKSFFFTTEALAVFDECCTQLEWAIVDSTKLKYTMAFGTKGGNIAEADDWAGQFNSRKQTLIDANNWGRNGYTAEVVDSHLF